MDEDIWDKREQASTLNLKKRLADWVEPKKYTWDETDWNYIIDIFKDTVIEKKPIPKSTKKKKKTPPRKKTFTREEVITKCIEMIDIFIKEGNKIKNQDEFLDYLKAYKENMMKK